MENRVTYKIYQVFSKFRKNESGAIAVETALIMTLLLTIALGVLDYGLLMARKMEVTNAVRAGAQYALVRKPVFDTSDASYDAYLDIKNATLAGLTTSKRATGATVTAALSCSCGNAASACFGVDPDPNSDPGTGDNLTCADGVNRSAYLDITLSESYTFVFGFVAPERTVTISDIATVRLN